MRNYAAASVDEYIASAPPHARPTLERLRKAILAAVPEAQEGISWGVPFYRHNGLLAGFAAYDRHASFGLAFVLPERIRQRLEKLGYRTGKKTVQIRYDQEVPTSIVETLVKSKAKENESASSRRRTTKASSRTRKRLG